MADSRVYRASTTAPVNIAVIKYWGKRDAKLNLPTNSSLSVTLAQSDLKAHTTASCSQAFSDDDSLILNGEPSPLTTPRSQACLARLRALRKILEDRDNSLPKLSQWPLRIVSINNFPTAAGLASSAAGFAALIRAIANLYELPQSPTELSAIARQGSGSACRSLFGGYVAWDAGTAADGNDSVAVEVAPASHWPEMRALVVVASAEKKGVPSTAGMQQTAATSTLFPLRVEKLVPARMIAMKEAIAKKDFATFADLTMQDSNSFHAVCLDTVPPIFYMNETSRAAVRLVEAINERVGRNVAAYTFDAGPNAVVYYLAENEGQVAGVFKSLLGDKDGWAGDRGTQVQEAPIEGLDERVVAVLKSGVSRVILTGVGEGPIATSDHLVSESGLPTQ
ncbi:diphosphomevalonate decarboxylase [Eremomyces bilateralis CBS 781.70]|uniref:Diphosphomevalonate decarboxylase n=1 Tax=Eremomyces bilateralis CBS 781.70 TaxID=1392243 RepID=A0A6G1G8Y8_9PEZI|nr:diphosphomevalonate decarboxylase [Eremomyces bilateralis CBS 781.70]KAF1814514.1 diphosphomevalonate decarboxylase [Eremomyces bilateralis CBS 781.70]